MLALLYLVLMVVLGDAICCRFFSFVSVLHRAGAAFLTGLLFSSWLTYLGALVFAGTSSPLLWANGTFALLAGAAIFLLSRASRAAQDPLLPIEKWDVVVLAFLAMLTTWMMFATFNISDGSLQLGQHEVPDFSATLSMTQSFAEGHNFPTEHPLFAGERIRAYFLFYFQVGNLAYLGINPAWSNNILSIFSTVSMLALIMTLGRVLFDSPVAGRIGAALFFFHGSLAFIPFFLSQASFAAMVEKLSTMTSFLNLSLGHRGDDWGVWTQNVFLTQRNFTSSIGLLLILLVFLVMRYRRSDDAIQGEVSDGKSSSKLKANKNEAKAASSAEVDRSFVLPYMFCGILLGLMPMWNGAVLVQGLLLLVILLAVFPLRREMLVLLGVTAVLAIPQLVYLKLGGRPGNFSYFHWGYLLDKPAVTTVVYYLLFIFGLKWLLVAVGAAWTGRIQRIFFAAVSAFLIFAFCTQLTDELLVNHKFFNIWLIIANVYVGYGLVKLWNLSVAGTAIPARVASAILLVFMTLGGVIDLLPIHNGAFTELKYKDDRLTDWVRTSTDPRAVFLSNRYMHHPILMAGRKLFFGTQYYAWEAGGDTTARENVYRKLFESTDTAEVRELLKQNNISYVAIDDTIRSGREFIKRPNESLYESQFELVFDDPEKRYSNLKIYRVR